MFVSRIVKAGSDLAVCVVNLLNCYNLLRKASDDYRNELAVLSCYTSAEAHEVTELEKLLRFAESAPVIENFDDELFQTFVDHIVVYGRDCIEFKLKCGLTLKEAI